MPVIGLSGVRDIWLFKILEMSSIALLMGSVLRSLCRMLDQIRGFELPQVPLLLTVLRG